MRIINLVENELGSSGCEAAHGFRFMLRLKNINFSLIQARVMLCFGMLKRWVWI